MKVLRTIGTLAIGATAGFVACGYLTVRGVLKSERHRKALADMVSEKISKELFVERAGASRVSYKARYEAMVESASDPKEIVFDTARSAEEVLDNIKEIINIHGYVTVADVCELYGLKSNRFEHEYGWTTISDMHIKNVDGKYTLYLPKAILLE